MSKKSNTVAIVGSGPSGAIVAKYLVENGIKVDMIDAGFIGEYKEPDINFYKSIIPKKTSLGSSHMYVRKDNSSLNFDNNSEFVTSHSFAGLSTVWGATLGFPGLNDLNDWPISHQELAGYMKEVMADIKISAEIDDIDDACGTVIKGESFELNSQVSDFILDNCRKYSDKIKSNNIYIGKSKLALNSSINNSSRCIKCGECMTGCRQGSIFNTAEIIFSLSKFDNFNYIQNSVVKKFELHSNYSSLFHQDNLTSKMIETNYSKIIIAAGAIDTAKIVTNSNLFNVKEFEFSDSQKYYLPVFVPSLKGFFRNENISKLSLAHLYIQSFTENKKLVQCQLYQSNPLFKIIFERYGILGSVLFKLLNPFLNFIYLAMVYLPSDVSGKITVNFKGDNINVQAKYNSASDYEFGKFVSNLFSNSLITKIIPLRIFTIKSKIGHSQHFGSSIPMTEDESKIGVNKFGKLNGTDNIYIVDSSILPTIPATPTTTIVMANALRIAKKIHLLSKEV